MWRLYEASGGYQENSWQLCTSLQLEDSAGLLVVSAYLLDIITIVITEYTTMISDWGDL